MAASIILSVKVPGTKISKKVEIRNASDNNNKNNSKFDTDTDFFLFLLMTSYFEQWSVK
jgi:hypothetical protein